MMGYCTNDAKKAGNFSGRKVSAMFRSIYKKLCPEFHYQIGRYISHCNDWWGDGSGDMLFIRSEYVDAFEEWARGLNHEVYELCPHCSNETEITMEKVLHTCSNCGASIAPCSLCDMDNCDCANCELSKKAEAMNKERVSDMDNAIAYVAKQVTKDEIRATYALMTLRRVPMFSVNNQLSDQIYDLMEEYGQDNDLPEGWWLTEYDEEEIFLKMVDAIK